MGKPKPQAMHGINWAETKVPRVIELLDRGRGRGFSRIQWTSLLDSVAKLMGGSQVEADRAINAIFKLRRTDSIPTSEELHGRFIQFRKSLEVARVQAHPELKTKPANPMEEESAHQLTSEIQKTINQYSLGKLGGNFSTQNREDIILFLEAIKAVGSVGRDSNYSLRLAKVYCKENAGQKEIAEVNRNLKLIKRYHPAIYNLIFGISETPKPETTTAPAPQPTTVSKPFEPDNRTDFIRKHHILLSGMGVPIEEKLARNVLFNTQDVNRIIGEVRKSNLQPAEQQNLIWSVLERSYLIDKPEKTRAFFLQVFPEAAGTYQPRPKIVRKSRSEKRLEKLLTLRDKSVETQIRREARKIAREIEKEHIREVSQAHSEAKRENKIRNKWDLALEMDKQRSERFARAEEKERERKKPALLESQLTASKSSGKQPTWTRQMYIDLAKLHINRFDAKDVQKFLHDYSGKARFNTLRVYASRLFGIERDPHKVIGLLNQFFEKRKLPPAKIVGKIKRSYSIEER